MKKFLKIIAVGALGGGLTVLPDAAPMLENKKLAEAILVGSLAIRLYLQNPPTSAGSKKEKE